MLWIAMVALLCAATGLGCAAGVLGLAMENRQPVGQQPDWPTGLADLLNTQKWVYAYWLNAIDRCYCSGDAEAFNRFISSFAKIGSVPERKMVTTAPDEAGRILPGETVLRLILHAGKKKTGAFDVASDSKIPCEWLVEVSGWNPVGSLGDSSIIPILELWTGGKVKLDKVKVPLKMEVISDGAPTSDITKFIADHEEKRKAKTQLTLVHECCTAPPTPDT